MNFRRRGTVLAALAALMGLAGPAAMAQETYPSKPIKLIVPWTPAGTVDIVARQLAERMSAKLGVPVVVENKAGATGQIGSQLVINSPADGYTLLVMSTTVHTVSPNFSKSFPFNPIDDFTPISQIVTFPYAMVVAADSPYKTVADLAAAAKKDPGKIAYGSFGIGSAPFLMSELFAMQTGTKLLHVPYKGASQAITDLGGGQIQFFIDSLPSPLGLIRGGKLRALSVTTAKRSATLPDVPTMGETVPGFDATAWLGIAAPAKTPRPVVQKIHAVLTEIAAQPDYAARLRDIGLEPVASPSPEQFRGFLVQQKQYWGDFIRKANLPMVN
ncbi:Bug family tripartite tricarboxylate transporter substrate binding protein [Lacisediminimonas profundi]|uniref:Bug family tripartite tricarboxylate transporter substrate binding protein n=1 Tax=Lacisediminimonas profundi TaxID=2603856 RepID=UPI0013869E0B|nr:tripartite tricarboxylate transporter substrate binding protein [Lacisediminimonas profundi]